MRSSPPVAPSLPGSSSSRLSHTADELPEIEASSAIEQIIIALWRDLIGISEIEGETDFFLSGGDSLVAGLVTARLTERLGREIPLRFVFEFPTVSAFATAIEEFLLADSEAFSDDQV
jgi:acyl carrier protein